ncbi:MAG: aminotransferase class V-fold PLP-dependent enzyme [Proteobacteria bacterium]|nr:aminotransferase class V-fold PLP-dependent enzyme [Pseudomonadota bacterium]
MTIRNGREILAIPGPTTIPDQVLQAMHRPAIEIYGGELRQITDSVLADLPKIFRSKGRPYIYIANGHGGWEAAISNVLSRGDKVLVLESGRFAVGWGEAGKSMGIDVEVLPGDWQSAVDPAKVEARLRADAKGEIKAVLVVQIDTASSCVNDIPAIRVAMDAAGHGALLMVDAIASLATMPFEMDAWGIDVALTGSQKGLMTPPGLALLCVNGKAFDAHEKADLSTAYWDWTRRDGNEHYQKYAGTPPSHMLFGLRKSLDMILEEGLENIFRRHALLAGAVQAAVGRWREGGVFDFNVPEPAARSVSVTTVRMKDGIDPAPLLKFCQEHCGVTVGIGIGNLAGKAFRIAHMGHINAPMTMGTLGALEITMRALALPHGAGGVQAAAEYLGNALKV